MKKSMLNRLKTMFSKSERIVILLAAAMSTLAILITLKLNLWWTLLPVKFFLTIYWMDTFKFTKHVYVRKVDTLLELALGEDSKEIYYMECVHCGDIKRLLAGQVQKMPKDLAKCEKSNVYCSLWELITGNYNCYAPDIHQDKVKI